MDDENSLLKYWGTMIKKRVVGAGIGADIVLLNTSLVFTAMNTFLMICFRTSKAFFLPASSKAAFCKNILSSSFVFLRLVFDSLQIVNYIPLRR